MRKQWNAVHSETKFEKYHICYSKYSSVDRYTCTGYTLVSGPWSCSQRSTPTNSLLFKEAVALCTHLLEPVHDFTSDLGQLYLRSLKLFPYKCVLCWLWCVYQYGVFSCNWVLGTLNKSYTSNLGRFLFRNFNFGICVIFELDFWS